MICTYTIPHHVNKLVYKVGPPFPFLFFSFFLLKPDLMLYHIFGIVFTETRWLFGTLFLNCDSVIQIYNDWVSLKKKMFGTLLLSEDSNLNLNFMWVPWQISEHLWTCFWIQSGFKSRLNLRGSQFYYLYWAHVPFLPIFSLFPLNDSLLLSLFLSAITEPHLPPTVRRSLFLDLCPCK